MPIKNAELDHVEQALLNTAFDNSKEEWIQEQAAVLFYAIIYHSVFHKWPRK